MKKYNLRFLPFLLITVFAFASCNKGAGPEENDTTKPELTVTKPQQGAVFSKSSDILLSGSFSDNIELERCTISLSYSGQKNVSIVETAWEPADDVISLSGPEYALMDRKIFGESIPSDILAGNYAITVTVTDNSGNIAASTIEITIE